MLASDDLLPKKVIDQYKMTREMWEERIKIWYAHHKGKNQDKFWHQYLQVGEQTLAQLIQNWLKYVLEGVTSA